MKFKIVFLLGFSLLFAACTFWTKSDKETIIEGKTTVLVDETLLPIVEAQKEEFKNTYFTKDNKKDNKDNGKYFKYAST